MQEDIALSQEDDEEMAHARKQAQQTFGFFWREYYWESRRIIPALNMASLKIMFTDESLPEDQANTEHMWIDQVDFDGTYITGFLINQPNWLRNVSQGDFVKTKLSDLSDWMFAIDKKVYGGYTINLLRSRMSSLELKEHDEAWGLDFGDPHQIDLVYFERKNGLLGKLFGNHREAYQQALIEHPMSINMGPSLVEELKDSPELLTNTDDLGWSALHKEALAGNATSVNILLEHGADRNMKTHNGETALDLAQKLKWGNVISILS